MEAVQKSFVVYAGEVLSIDFLRKVYNPQVNGIEIVSLNAKDATTVVLSNSPGNHFVNKKGLTILHDSGRIVVKNVDKSKASLQVQVTDNLGRIYYSESISTYASEVEINAQSLPSGMYIVRVNEQAGKLILE